MLKVEVSPTYYTSVYDEATIKTHLSLVIESRFANDHDNFKAYFERSHTTSTHFIVCNKGNLSKLKYTVL